MRSSLELEDAGSVYQLQGNVLTSTALTRRTLATTQNKRAARRCDGPRVVRSV